MTNSLGQIKEFVGVDVSQDRLDVCLLPSGAQAGFSRDRRGIARLVAWLVSQATSAGRGRGDRRFGADADGGARACRDRGRGGQPAPDPRLRPGGRAARQDRPARCLALALYAERLRPEPRPPRSTADQALAALVLRRRQLAQLIEAERNRARRAEEPAVLASIEAHLGWLQTAFAELEDQIDQRLARHPCGRSAPRC